MKIDIKDKKKNELLHRTEIHGHITFAKATPNRNEVRAEVAKQLSVDAGVVVMKGIIGSFGGGSAEFDAFAYDSADALNKIETQKGQKQVAKKEEPKKEEKPTEAPAAKPAEEKKEEAPAAEKAEKKPAEEKKEAPAEKPAEAEPAKEEAKSE